MDEILRQNITRRRFLQLSAVTAVAAACNPSSVSSPSSAPAGGSPAGGPSGGGASAGSGGVTGTINVSYPDEAGLKPKYVEQAAAAVKSQFPGADVKIDLQKIGDDDYYT